MALHRLLIFYFFSAPLFAQTTTLPALKVTGRRSLHDSVSTAGEFSGREVFVGGSSTPSSLSVPGLEKARDSSETYAIRGLSPNQTRTFLDSVSLTDAEFNASDFSLVPWMALASAEVFAEGVPASLTSDGLGGALNWNLVGPEFSQNRLWARGGSYGAAQAAAQVAEGRSLPWAVDIDFTRSQEDFDYLDNGGTPFNATDDSWVRQEDHAYTRVSLLPRAMVPVGLGTIRFYSLLALKGSEVSAMPATGSALQLNQRYGLFSVQGKFPLEKNLDSETLLFGRMAKDTLRNENANPGAGLGPLGTVDSEGEALGGHQRFVWRADPIEWHLGFLAQENAYRADFSNLPSDGETLSRTDLGAHSAVQWKLTPSTSLSPAILFHHYEYSGAANRKMDLLSPRIGLRQDWTKGLRSRAAVGSYYRAPTLFELHGHPRGLVPNEGLVRESAFRWELGMDWVQAFSGPIEEARLSYTVASISAKDLITYVSQSPNTAIAQNTGRARLVAHEVSAEFRFPQGFFLRSLSSWLLTENQSETLVEKGRRLPGRYPFRETIAGGQKLGAWSWEVSADFYSARFTDLANEKYSQGYSLLGSRLEWEARQWGRIALEVQNVLNETVGRSVWSGESTVENINGWSQVPASGRRVYLSWAYDL